MGSQKISFYAIFFLMGSALLLILPGPALTQDYPTKPITVYCGYEAGATTDLSARGLAAGLVASKKPDGYTLGVVSTGVITVRPHIFKVSYNPFKDLTLVAQYSRFIGGLCVLSESPLKTIDDFIAYAKAKPGLTYGSPGTYTQTHMAVELFSQCKGLNLKHVPYKGGAPASTALLGKHTDFLGGSGGHIPYVKQGVFRMLMLLNAEKRDPDYPNIPILNDLGCPDAPTLGMIVVAPRGLPESVCQKLTTAVKQVTDGEEFQRLLKNLDLPCEFKDGKAMEKGVAAEHALYKELLLKMGAKVLQ